MSKTMIVFGSLSYTTQDEYLKFLNELDQPKAVAMLVAAAAYAQGKGVYSMEESEIIVNSVRKLLPAAAFSEMVDNERNPKKEDGPTG